MPITLPPITGAVSIALDGHEGTTVATFEVPVTVNVGPDGIRILSASPHDEILTAAATALRNAAERLLDSIPHAEVATLPEGESYPVGTLADHDARIIACPDCDHTIAHDGPGTIQHFSDASHLFRPGTGGAHA